MRGLLADANVAGHQRRIINLLDRSGLSLQRSEPQDVTIISSSQLPSAARRVLAHKVSAVADHFVLISAAAAISVFHFWDSDARLSVVELSADEKTKR